MNVEDRIATPHTVIYQLCINRCPKHSEFYSVSLEEAEGGGTRITPSKCCGQWKTIRAWKMSKRDLQELAELCLNAAEEVTDGK